MVARHGPTLIRVANQFSLCHDDALDAYQRALEIYLRRFETVDVATEGAWLRVVVKHEAMAIRKARAAQVDVQDTDFDASEAQGLREVADTVAGEERVGRSVEALKALKPDEARALLLKAEGLSYDEIGRRFGWSYTKVNRSIAEGRKRFLNVFSEIESGEACAAYEDTLDALARGKATSVQMVSIRPHLRHCAACRATVRQMRFSRTRRIALLAPFGWISRVLSRPDVGNTVYAASNGGGRLGPAAALVGLCLSGAGAGACIVTGALPAPAIIAAADRAEPTATAEPEAPKQARSAEKKPVKAAKNEPPARTYAAVATATPVPTPRAVTRKVKVKTPKTKLATRKPKPTEFGFEGDAKRAAAPTDGGGVKAGVASVNGGGGGSAPTRSGGGGASKPIKEFGFESGG
ncbi:hypothetical protein OJ997_30685 [Solirubrobacter phytolaccae]|uniref:RNA polymerase sigma factor 70 region 4 type 2 domain-containing protein n=1 Tax=Solirubrobacter phytolaccae TaxID=1404360 RepID=A0A9X3NEJ9_9ACTN|nr:sigma-70 family RNA polymerase sigma factor [Solirubrobacter phytolaccae]MDA0184709.1 hypothetical protein [Solirubrobacter phytolaccae]